MRVHTTSILLLLSLFLTGAAFGSSESALKTYLKFVHGDPRIKSEEALHHNPDNWMIPGQHQPELIKQVESTNFSFKEPGIFNGFLGGNLIFIEISDGKAKPNYILHGIYTLHTKIVQMFLYEALLQNERALKQLTTNHQNIHFGGAPAAGYGDMDVYAGVIGLIPIIRSSEPSEDSKSRSITYKLPITTEGFDITLVKVGSSWKIDASKKVVLPMEFFYQ